MPTGATSIASANFSCKGDNSEQDDWKDFSPDPFYIRCRVEDAAESLIDFADTAGGKKQYEEFERQLIPLVLRFGRLLIALFLSRWQQRTPVPSLLVRGKETYERKEQKSRLLGTFFGKVRYWRTYVLQSNGRPGGYFPMDTAAGLPSDGFSIGTLGRVVRLSTKMSYAAAAVLMKSFVGWSPSTKTIEEATLGFGRYTTEWVESRPPPEGDGEVLIIQIDGKAVPTARKEELLKRRGKRKPNPYPNSPRHRGRHKRLRRGTKKRRKKGDKSKNGKQAMMVVMYTLKQSTYADGEPMLLGPINRWNYASYAPKRHAFSIARREANKRGFDPDSGKRIQLLTDGDPDLELYGQEYFPEAIHSLDVIHPIEKLWEVGGILYREGSDELSEWVEDQKERLYDGRVRAVIAELRSKAKGVEKKKKRERMESVAKYLSKRAHMMNYDELEGEDLELSTGIVEGTVRYIIAQRFDEGGMRWIKERAEALLQLRCIEKNGDWESFIAFVSSKLTRSQRASRRQKRLQQRVPEPLPTYGIAS